MNTSNELDPVTILDVIDGLVLNTSDPAPVSSVTIPLSSEEVVFANEDSLSVLYATVPPLLKLILAVSVPVRVKVLLHENVLFDATDRFALTV